MTLRVIAISLFAVIKLFSFFSFQQLLKKKKNAAASNYRPISLLSTFSKTFEKLILKIVCCFLFKHKMLSKSQYVFQPSKSCIDALFIFVSFLKTTIDSKLPDSAIFVNLKKRLIL